MTKNLVIPEEVIMNKIYLVRGHKVMLDKDLAELYGVTTGNLNKAVKRNLKRFPSDFMMQLEKEEFKDLLFQNGRSSWGGTRSMPYGFTEQGVAMLSSVLNSDRAIEINIMIIRVFVKIKEMLLTHKDILLKLEEIEKKVAGQDEKIKQIFQYLKQLIDKPNQPCERIGYKNYNEE